MNADKSIEYNIVEIKTNQFAIFENAQETGGKKSINTSFSYGIDVNEKRFICIVDIVYKLDESPVIKIQTQAVYKLKEQSFQIFIEGEDFIMDPQFVKHFTNLLLNTTRGILICKLENTQYNQNILPEINLEDVIKTPLNIKLNN